MSLDPYIQTRGEKMISDAMVKALNDQIREELESSYIYLSFSAELDALNLAGAAAWFRKQSNEERGHAMRFYDFINDVGGKVVLQTLAQPAGGLSGLKDAFTKALAHERHISSCIHKLVKAARQADDLPTESFLKWFIDEQVEEEKTVADILAKIELAAGNVGSLFVLDRDLGEAAAE